LFFKLNKTTTPPSPPKKRGRLKNGAIALHPTLDYIGHPKIEIKEVINRAKYFI
jgi:hypothetical protein